MITNSVFDKAIENARKHRLVKKRNCIVLEPSYHTTKFFSETLLAIEMKITQILMNKAVFLGISILELGKIVMYKFQYDCVKLKYEEKVKLF